MGKKKGDGVLPSSQGEKGKRWGAKKRRRRNSEGESGFKKLGPRGVRKAKQRRGARVFY